MNEIVWKFHVESIVKVNRAFGESLFYSEGTQTSID